MTPMSYDEIRALLAEAEALDAEQAAAEAAERALLASQITAGARWLRRRAAKLFRRLGTEITDEPGHWDNSFGPDEYVVTRTEERLLVVYTAVTAERATSSGYYHDYEIVTQEPGCAVDGDGTIWSITDAGSARLGQYAAHPATCNRQIGRTFAPVREPTLKQLRNTADLIERCVRAARDGVIADAEYDEDVLKAHKIWVERNAVVVA